MELKDEINDAIAAHGMWVARLGQAISTGQSELTAARARLDNQCEFGRWLYGDTIRSADRASDHYRECRELHQRFHWTAAEVLELALGGKRTAAQKAMALDSEFSRVSAALTKALARWRDAAE